MTALRATADQVIAFGRRDLRLQLSYHFQLTLRVFTAAMSVVLFFFVGQLVGRSDYFSGLDGGYFEFVLLGLVLAELALTVLSIAGQSIMQAQNDATLEILLATSVRVGVVMAGTLVVPLLFSLVNVAVILALGSILSGVVLDGAGLLLAVVPLLLTLGTFAAIGIMSAAVIVLTKRGDPFSNMAAQASNLLAGAFFPVVLLPGALQALAHLVPAFYGLRAMRAALLGDAGLVDIAGDVMVLIGFNLGLFPVALWMLSRSLRIARVTGTLGNR